VINSVDHFFGPVPHGCVRPFILIRDRAAPELLARRGRPHPASCHRLHRGLGGWGRTALPQVRDREMVPRAHWQDAVKSECVDRRAHQSGWLPRREEPAAGRLRR
jgi:hypothetical protein